MLKLIRELIAPKVGMRLLLRGNFPIGSSMKLQDLMRLDSLYGHVLLVKNSHALITLEGSKLKLEFFVARLQKVRLIPDPVVIEVTWL